VPPCCLFCCFQKGRKSYSGQCFLRRIVSSDSKGWNHGIIHRDVQNSKNTPFKKKGNAQLYDVCVVVSDLFNSLIILETFVSKRIMKQFISI